MKALARVACAVLLCFVAVSCGKSPYEPRGDRDSPKVVYFNSFESAQDTTGWVGISDQMFARDPAPGGGYRSLHIGGGCIQPTAHILLPAKPYDASYRLSCWGRLDAMSQRGSLVLATDMHGGGREEVGLVVVREKWAFYRSETPLYCPAHQRLRLELWIGGFVPAAMSIDCIKVEMVE